MMQVAILLLISVFGGLLPEQHAALSCGNGAETQPVFGPDNKSAVLKVSSEDDHSKNTHLCMAEYRLRITGPSEIEPHESTISLSDGAWDRELSMTLSGFSPDGKRVFGVLTEGGPTPIQELFDHNTVDGQARLTDLRKAIAYIAPAKCRPTVEVVGTTEGGAVVVQLSSADDCVANSRWVVNSVKKRLEPLGESTAVTELYRVPVEPAKPPAKH